MKSDLRLLLIFVGVCSLFCVGMLRITFEQAWDVRVAEELRDATQRAEIDRLHFRLVGVESDLRTIKTAVMMHVGVPVPLAK